MRVPHDKIDALKSYAGRISRQREPANRADVLSRLRQHQDLFERFGVKAAWLFGSVARDQARPLSDVDLMVEFHPGHPGGLFRYVELKHALEGLLGRPVDLVTAGRLKPRLAARVRAECEEVF